MSRKGFNSRFATDRFEYGHDNRFGGEQTIRRVVHQGGFKKNKNNQKWQRLQQRLGDFEVDIGNEDHSQRGPGGSGNNSRGTWRFRGRGRGRGGSFVASVGQALKKGQWYQITIVNGARYDRNTILSRIEAHIAPQNYFPICYQIVRSDSEFYVETYAMAQLMLSCTRKIRMDDGETLVIRIKEGRPPTTPIDTVATNKIKQVMSKRFVAENKALDLTKFFRDPEFVDGMNCTLNRPPVLQAVLKIISENIPDLMALNLSGNSITELEPAANEFKTLKHLRILYLTDNLISALAQLNCLKSLQITEMALDRNPIIQSFADHSHLVSELRKRFPALTKLDSTVLPAAVSFDVGEESSLPAAQAACISTAEGRDFVKAFLSQYFEIYDSDNRVQLTQAYAENAMFSFTATYNREGNKEARLNTYFANSRNILRVPEIPRRRLKVQKDRETVVDFLYKHLPKTQHDLPSFVVDLPIFLPQLIHLVVSGIFRETGVGEPTNWPLRYFSRTFMIVPVGTGFCITNDMLHVTNCTDDQRETAFKVEPVKSTAITPANAPLPTSPASRPAIDDSVKLQMVQAVAQQTGMNLDWSRKCLEETEWDFQRAGFTFTELQKRGAIPAEAFIK